MKDLYFLCTEIWRNKSVLRAYLNLHLKELEVQGRVIDIGGGGKSSTYLEHIKLKNNTEIINFDPKIGSLIDFEKDSLPCEDNHYDTVLFLNVMEHIFNHQHIANEVVRILKPDGLLIGYVPFLMWYHPDPKDFFRYTHEALEIIMSRAGAKNIHIEAIAPGPFTIAAHMTILSLPRFLRPLWFAPLYFLDKLFARFQNKPDKRHVLGYLFILRK
ncbi:MAG: class I SAM-dependent methyltransferase [Candidatus Pacebacteria bacterium]|jgi:SAM-dependent methyltransferase|nr:class I SAM-dependent methyltransferase [Candidatus Paceibacterota bacterium]